jgi:RNA polymerase sigma-70 factor (ECF subfamily)
MGTTISEGSYASAKTGKPPENRNTDFSAFRKIDQSERAAPDVEETLHRPEDALTAQEVNRRSTMDGATPGNGVLRKPSAEYGFKKGLASAVHQSSAQAAEGALIDQILSGHKELFMELIRPHQRTVYATVFALLVNRQDAEDVAQDALLKALARLHQFRRESSFGTWLIQIAINEARMRNRKQWRIPMLSLTDDKHDAKAYVPKDFEDWREIPSTALERVEVRDALVKALGSLARHYREAFVLRDIHELSISETSAILGISPGAVKSRLRRARLMLRDILAPGLGHDGRLGWASKEVRKPWE